jgi:DNA-binding transcriptional MerR regulator
MAKKAESDRNQYTIGEVSERTGIKQYILRYWEKEFPFLQPMKNRAGHRLYTERDIFIVQSIKELLYERGYSTQGAKNVLFNMLLGRYDNDRERYLSEIRSDLYDMLDAINSTL